MFSSSNIPHPAAQANVQAPKASFEFSPQDAVSFEFFWQGLSSISEDSEIQEIKILFNKSNQYRVIVPKSSIDHRTGYFIQCHEISIIENKTEFIPRDYIKVPNERYAHQMSMLAKIVTTPINTNIKSSWKLLTNKKSQRAQSEEKISLDLSIIKPGHHYKILMSRPHANANLEAKLIEAGVFKKTDRKSIEEYKPPLPFNFDATLNSLVQALGKTEPDHFDPKFAEIISLGQQMLRNLTLAALSDEAKKRQLQIIFLGTLISAYSFHRWKNFTKFTDREDRDFESLYFWMITAGMARIITGDNVKNNNQSPYRNPHHAVYDFKTRSWIFVRMILVIGNQLMNGIQRFDVELYKRNFRSLLLQWHLTEIAADIPRHGSLNALDKFFEQQDKQIDEFMQPHQLSRSLSSATLEEKEKPAPNFKISTTETTSLHQQLINILETPLSTTIYQLRIQLLSTASKNISLFSETQKNNLKTAPTDTELTHFIHQACWRLIEKLDPDQFKMLCLLKSNTAMIRTTLQKSNNTVLLTQLAQDVLSQSTPLASQEQINTMATQLTRYLANYPGEEVESTLSVDAYYEFKKIIGK